METAAANRSPGWSTQTIGVPRVKCTVSVVGIGNGARWVRSVRRPDEYYDLLDRAAADRTRRALEGASEF